MNFSTVIIVAIVFFLLAIGIWFVIYMDRQDRRRYERMTDLTRQEREELYQGVYEAIDEDDGR